MGKRNFNLLILILTSLFIPSLLFSQVDTAWVRRYNGPANDSDLAVAIVRDNLGNIYVTGWSYDSITKFDYTTIKYDINGNELWKRKYDAKIPGNYSEEVRDVAIDNFGNIYLTGSGGTVKYNSEGEELWIKNYPGDARAIGVDNSNNVYVAGEHNYDFLLIKYDANGKELWRRTYGNPSYTEGIDYMAIDNWGNVYVAGYTYFPRWMHARIVKYDGEGNVLWTRICAVFRFTWLAGIHVDNNGNFYVAVNAYEPPPYDWLVFSLFKHDRNGNLLWRLNSSTLRDKCSAFTVDESENVYVAGSNLNDTTLNDYLTIKYDRNGNQLWARKYNGPNNGDDVASSLVVDEEGNVYVTGISEGDYLTIKYSPEGNEIWVDRYNGSGDGEDNPVAIALDSWSNIYITGKSYSGPDSFFDYTTLKYSPNGNLLWIRKYNGPGDTTDVANKICIDNSNNIYVIGKSIGLGTNYDYTTIKYDGNGNELWVKRYNRLISCIDRAYAIAIDSFNNLYITGSSYSELTSFDYLTIKYDTNGNLLWARKYNGQYDDYASAIATDNLGNVYVTGKSCDSVNNYDYITIKYDQNGNELWIRRYNGPANWNDCAKAIAVDNNGNVYVTGISYGDNTVYDYATIKYDIDGNLLWVRRYDGPENLHDDPSALAVDNLGNVYVTGGSYSRATLEDYLTIKYSSEGDLLWERRYSGSGYYADKATAIVVDNCGNVYVTGYSMMVYSYDYATIKYNTNGDQLWVRTYNGPGSNRDEAYSITLDNQGNIYVTGRSQGQNTSFDYATVKYDTNGNELWVARYNGPGNGNDVACGIVVDDWGNVYVTGYSYGSGTSFDYCTIKYIQTGGMKEDKTIKIEKKKFKERKNLYDITGKLIQNKKLKKGIYFIKTEKENKKIIILK